MRYTSFSNSIFLATAMFAGLLFGSSVALAQSDPVPVLASEPDPIEHTAQDEGDLSGFEDHTAQDGDEPVNGPPARSTEESKKQPDSGRKPPENGHSEPDSFKEPSFTAPLVDILDITTWSAPGAEFLFNGDDLSTGLYNAGNPIGTDDSVVSSGPSITSSSIPSPGVLVVIGLGALTLNRRRRR